MPRFPNGNIIGHCHPDAKQTVNPTKGGQFFQAAKSLPTGRWAAKKLWSPTLNGIESTSLGRIGHFCVTGA
ncbi:MAG TPA: hypothetical protein VIP49_05160 [Candidatus Udaeobacter sp.]